MERENTINFRAYTLHSIMIPVTWVRRKKSLFLKFCGLLLYVTLADLILPVLIKILDPPPPLHRMQILFQFKGYLPSVPDVLSSFLSCVCQTMVLLLWIPTHTTDEISSATRRTTFYLNFLFLWMNSSFWDSWEKKVSRMLLVRSHSFHLKEAGNTVIAGLRILDLSIPKYKIISWRDEKS